MERPKAHDPRLISRIRRLGLLSDQAIQDALSGCVPGDTALLDRLLDQGLLDRDQVALLRMLEPQDEDPLLLRQAIQLAVRLRLVSPQRGDLVLADLDQGNLLPTIADVSLAAGIDKERLDLLLLLEPPGGEGASEQSAQQFEGLQIGERVPRSGKIGRYQLVREIARGGMGVVYEALDPALGRSVAIKTLLSRKDDQGELVARLRREAQLAGRVAHPGIINVHEVGEDHDDAGGEAITYVVMDHVPGPTLAQAFADLTPDSRIGILRQVCRAMAEAHLQGVIHRDLKPSNILLHGEHAIITDFGLARGGELSTLVTRSGAVLGTPTYMAPEQVLGQDEAIGATVDVWALGVMLYEMSTGALPFRGSSATAVFGAILAEPLQLPRKLAPGMSLDFEAICLKALDSRPGRRYPDAGALSADLERWSGGYPVTARRATRTYLLCKWASRHRAAVAAAAGVLLSVIGAFIGVGYQLRNARVERQQAHTARRATAAERDKVVRKQRELERSLADLESMADVYRVAQLQRQLDALGPQGWKVAALRAWLTGARELQRRMANHQQILHQLEQAGRLTDTERWQRELIAGLIPRIEPLLKAIPTVEGWLRNEQWRKWRQHATPRWRRAIQAIRGNPKYGALRIKRQEGLVPLGRDPKTTLWEFAHLPSGTAPQRNATGKLVITDRTGIVLVLIPGGAFRMGTTRTWGASGLNQDRHIHRNEGPVHPVHLGPFFLSKYELTQGQWLRMTGSNPSSYKSGMKVPGQHARITLTHPVERVNWPEANRWLQRWGLILPTEAQWEYAARAGTRSMWWTGNITAGLPAAGNLRDQAFFRAARIKPFEAWDDGYSVHAPVGRFAANDFGLHDVIGNVQEWCRDPYLQTAYGLAQRGPEGWRTYPAAALGDRAPRVWRGGCWSTIAFSARSAMRFWGPPDLRANLLGLRPGRPVLP